MARTPLEVVLMSSATGLVAPSGVSVVSDRFDSKFSGVQLVGTLGSLPSHTKGISIIMAMLSFVIRCKWIIKACNAQPDGRQWYRLKAHHHEHTVRSRYLMDTQRQTVMGIDEI